MILRVIEKLKDIKISGSEEFISYSVARAFRLWCVRHSWCEGEEKGNSEHSGGGGIGEMLQAVQSPWWLVQEESNTSKAFSKDSSTKFEHIPSLPTCSELLLCLPNPRNYAKSLPLNQADIDLDYSPIQQGNTDRWQSEWNCLILYSKVNDFQKRRLLSSNFS